MAPVDVAKADHVSSQKCIKKKKTIDFQQLALPRPLERAASSKKHWTYNVSVIPIFALLDGSLEGR